MATKLCRSCGGAHVYPFLDLGAQPASNGLLKNKDDPAKLWPLEVGVCQSCGLIQTLTNIPADALFTDEYPYFSGQSKQWVEHCNAYAEMAIKRFGLTKQNPPLLGYAGETNGSTVVEIGGNDGTLLKAFKDRVSLVLNIEPCASVAAASRAAGVPVLNFFFGGPRGQGDHPKADLLIANNVMAHTPDLNGFAHAAWETLKPGGTLTVEFPWALNLIQGGQFDTIYHEHYSYLSLHALHALFKRHKLRIYDVERLPTHGGSLRIYVHRTDVACPQVTEAFQDAFREEYPLTSVETYREFSLRALRSRAAFLRWMAKKPDVVGYGAAAKGNTFLNYCEVTAEEIPLVADTTPAKQGMFLPGSCIPVVPESIVFAQDPEYLLVLAWNWRDEIIKRIRKDRPHQKFVTAIPTLEFDNG